MSVRIAPAIVVPAVLLAALLAGCSEPEPTPSPSTTLTSSEPTTSTPTPTPLTPEEEATAAAEEVVRAYFETVPRCLADPVNTEPSCFEDVAIGTELNDRRNSLIAARQADSSASGTLEVISLGLACVKAALTQGGS